MYYNRNAQGKSLQAHFIMPFLTEKAQSAVATTQSGGYEARAAGGEGRVAANESTGAGD